MASRAYAVSGRLACHPPSMGHLVDVVDAEGVADVLPDDDIHLPAYAGADADGAMHGLEDGALEGEWKPREPERWTELGLNVAALYL